MEGKYPSTEHVMFTGETISRRQPCPVVFCGHCLTDGKGVCGGAAERKENVRFRHQVSLIENTK